MYPTSSYIPIPTSPRDPEDRPAQITRQMQQMRLNPSPTKESTLFKGQKESHFEDWSYDEDDASQEESNLDASDLTFRLRKALLRQHPAEIRQCLALIQQVNESIESHLERAFVLLNQNSADSKLVSLYRKFRSCVNLLEYSPIETIESVNSQLDKDPVELFFDIMKRKDPTTLHAAISLADRKHMPITTILQAVNKKAEGKSFFIANVLSTVQKLSQIPFHAHALPVYELVRIASVVENEFQQIDHGMRYLLKQETRCQVPLLLDLKTRSFALITKRVDVGLVKKAREAIVVPHQGHPITDLVALTNLDGQRIEQKEIERLIHYAAKRKARGVTAGEVHSFFVTKSRQVILQQKAEGRLLDIDEEFSPEKLLDVFEQIAFDVRDMHDDDLCHSDLSFKNVLYKTLPNGSYLVWVSDLGLAFQPKQGEVPKTLVKKSYGTASSTSPETIKSPAHHHHGKPKDMYAIGVMLHEKLRGELPWIEEITRYFKSIDNKLDEDLREQILQKQQAIADELRPMRKIQENGDSFTCIDALTFVMLSLLDPNPKTRMTASYFAECISQIRKEYLRLASS